MTAPRRRRRRIDLAIGLAIAVVVALTGVVLWHTGDARATSSLTAPSSAVPTTPSEPSAVPTSLRQIWSLDTDGRLGAVVSPYGSVVTADAHTVTGHDLRTGAALWSYGRSNESLCAVGSSDTDTGGLDTWGAVRGVVTVYARNGWCSQVTTFNPTTGARIYTRTSPNLDPGQLVFGGPYAAWLGSDLLELWRHDLLRTIQYGNQPNPVNSDGPHTGCTFSDLAIADKQFATIEHCQDQPGAARLVVNYDDPGGDAKDKGWDAMHSQPRATIDTQSPVAVLVGITPDREAILVTSPTPALVIYDNAGTEISRTPVDMPAAEIAATARAGATPSVTINTRRYSLVGSHLISVSAESVQAPAPTSTSESSRPSATTGPAPMVSVQSPHLDWIASGVLGLPTRIGGTVVAPVAAGLIELAVADGKAGRTVAVNRGGYQGRVDVTAVGSVVVEVRGGTVVGYSPTP
jgi:hypothetical protein